MRFPIFLTQLCLLLCCVISAQGASLVDHDSLSLVKSSLLRSGAQSYNEGDLTKALGFFHQANKLVSSPINNSLDLSIVKNYLAILGLAGDYESFKKQSLDLLKSFQLDTCNHTILKGLLGALNNIAALATAAEDNMLARKVYIYHQDLISICGCSEIDQVQMKANIAQLEMVEGNFNVAKQHLKFLKNYQGKIASFGRGDYNLLNTLYHFEGGIFDSAIWYMYEACNAFLREANPERALEPLDFMLDRAAEGLTVKQSLAIANRSTFLRDSLNFSKGENYHKLLESLSEIYALEESIEQTKRSRFWYGLIAIMIFFLSLFFLMSFRAKQARLKLKSSILEVQIAHQKASFERQKQDLQKDIASLKDQILDERINWWETFNEQKSKLKDLAETRQSMLDGVAKLLPSFESKLKQKFPSLTPSEYALLITIFLGFSAKQAADILCVSENSYRVAKSRLLRKKMEINDVEQIFSDMAAITPVQNKIKGA